MFRILEHVTVLHIEWICGRHGQAKPGPRWTTPQHRAAGSAFKVLEENLKVCTYSHLVVSISKLLVSEKHRETKKCIAKHPKGWHSWIALSEESQHFAGIVNSETRGRVRPEVLVFRYLQPVCSFGCAARQNQGGRHRGQFGPGHSGNFNIFTNCIWGGSQNGSQWEVRQTK